MCQLAGSAVQQRGRGAGAVPGPEVPASGELRRGGQSDVCKRAYYIAACVSLLFNNVDLVLGLYQDQKFLPAVSWGGIMRKRYHCFAAFVSLQAMDVVLGLYQDQKFLPAVSWASLCVIIALQHVSACRQCCSTTWTWCWGCTRTRSSCQR
jgi:hypothetical protein